MSQGMQNSLRTFLPLKENVSTAMDETIPVHDNVSIYVCF